MSDSAVAIDIQGSFDAIGRLRTAIAGVTSSSVIGSPDVGVVTASESLAAVVALIGGFPGFAAHEATLLANGETLGAMDAYRADNPCINWYGVAEG